MPKFTDLCRCWPGGNSVLSGGCWISMLCCHIENKVDDILQTIFSIKDMNISIKFHWNMFIRVRLTKKKSLVGIMSSLTHWGRVTHICVSKLTIIGSDNGLSPDWRQAITWTSTGILLIGPLGTNFSEILVEIYAFSFKKMHLKMSSGKWRPFCLGLNMLNEIFFAKLDDKFCHFFFCK